MLDIKGVKKSESENTDEIVLKLAALMNVQLSQEEIYSHRTSAKHDAGIIVKFTSRKTRDIFWSHRKSIYIWDSLKGSWT